MHLVLAGIEPYSFGRNDKRYAGGCSLLWFEGLFQCHISPGLQQHSPCLLELPGAKRSIRSTREKIYIDKLIRNAEDSIKIYKNLKKNHNRCTNLIGTTYMSFGVDVCFVF